jgi:hypothetical protein
VLGETPCARKHFPTHKSLNKFCVKLVVVGSTMWNLGFCCIIATKSNRNIVEATHNADATKRRPMRVMDVAPIKGPELGHDRGAEMSTIRHIVARNVDALRNELGRLLSRETAYITEDDYKRITEEDLDDPPRDER